MSEIVLISGDTVSKNFVVAYWVMSFCNAINPKSVWPMLMGSVLTITAASTDNGWKMTYVSSFRK